MVPKQNWKTCVSLVLKHYCKDTSITGFKYLVQLNRPPIEKCIWAAILITTCSMTFYIFHLLMDDYNNKATVTTLETTKYHITNVPFPGIAICNVNRISKKQVLKMSTEIYQKINVSQEELFYLMKNFGTLYDFQSDKPKEMRKLQNIIDRYNSEINSNFDSLINILQQLSPSCEETLVKCKWIGQEVDCQKIFYNRRTMDGYCCTFNYVKSWNDYNFSKYNSNLLEDNMKQMYFSGAGHESGLTVIVHTDPEDYFYPLTSTEGFSIKIFNAHDYPDVGSGALIESYIPLKHEVFMQISATTIKAVPNLKYIPIRKRHCVFENEGKTVFDSTFYSYSDCLSDCKLKSILALCECVPFFLPVLKTYAFSKQICTVADIPCLHRYKDKWLNIYPQLDIEELEYERENSLHCPHCLPSCFSTSYGVDIDQTILTQIPYKDLKNLDLNKHSIIHIYSDVEETLLYESDIVYYWFDIIGNFGGTCSLFLGFSLISIVEFLYFITIKYYNLLQNI